MSNLLDDLKKKLNEMLDTELSICQNYSSIVIIMYKKILLHLNGQMEIGCFRDDINQLISCVIEEDRSFRKILSYDRSTLLPKIDSHIENEDGSPEYLRFVNKLRFVKSIYNGLKITARELNIDKIPSDMEFDIYSAIFSVIYIDVFRKILDKLESLSYDDEQDELFIGCLFGELNFKIIYRCSCNDLFEMMSLYNDMDINKFPDISMDVLKKSLGSIYKGFDIDSHINDVLYNSIVDDIAKMRWKNNLNNNPEDVFEYLYFITKMNVVMSYLNKMYLSKLLEYCNNNGFNNSYICSDVKRLIRVKLSE